MLKDNNEVKNEELFERKELSIEEIERVTGGVEIPDHVFDKDPRPHV